MRGSFLLSEFGCYFADVLLYKLGNIISAHLQDNQTQRQPRSPQPMFSQVHPLLNASDTLNVSSIISSTTALL